MNYQAIFTGQNTSFHLLWFWKRFSKLFLFRNPEYPLTNFNNNKIKAVIKYFGQFLFIIGMSYELPKHSQCESFDFYNRNL